jgi:adenine-specific DNA methylase
MNVVALKPSVVPFSLKDAPSLIERVWPAQKISVETKREFDAHGAQTLTPLGSYWKGRKRLVYVRACVLGALLPATEDPERDLEIFEQLMAIDDRAFLARETKAKPSEIARLAIAAGALREEDLATFFSVRRVEEPKQEDFSAAMSGGYLNWDCSKEDQDRLRLAAYSCWSYVDKVSRCLRPEELSETAYDGIWADVNRHLRTSARSMTELVEQLGVMRFGHRPKVADTFCGAGSIPFEAARVGCDVYASDLNPIACMLTWGALHLIGGGDRLKADLEAAQKHVADEVDRRIIELGIEHDERGNRAKAYLYCVEARCPITGWLVPLLPSLIISRIRRTIAKLVPNAEQKRIDIEVVCDVTSEEMEGAKLGTVQDRALVYTLDGETFRTKIAAIRGEYRTPTGDTGNKLRRWECSDVIPRGDDAFGERLYCIQWTTKETSSKKRKETFFSTPTEHDVDSEAKVINLVRSKLATWQAAGFVPDMQIEPGVKTGEPIRTRGWTHWHHLFTPRQLLIGAFFAEEAAKIENQEIRGCLSFDRTFLANFSSRLSQWLPGSPGIPGRAAAADQVKGTFYNQALNTFYNFGCRAWTMCSISEDNGYKFQTVATNSSVKTHSAENISASADIFITDPPYADAVFYHEITEFFIAWLRRNPPSPFQDWVWDARRSLAIKGDGDDFRKAMVLAYRAMAEKMPDNGLQVVMFTHTDASVWGDMAQIFWGSGLQVMAAWYVSTETTSETKKGGYVQGTVTLVLRKRKDGEHGYKDEIVQEVKVEVADQIDTMSGLNQSLKGHGRIENLFEDADLQMAGYAAALRILTRYTTIDGIDMTKEALRARVKGERGLVADIIEFAVQIANEHMVPEGMAPKVWENLTGSERFYFKMMDVEETGAKKLDNYQNFSRAFRVPKYDDLMGSMEPNKARLKSAKEFKKAGFEGSEFGTSKSRALLYAIYEIQRDVDGDDVLSHLRDLAPDYFDARDDLSLLADYIAKKRAHIDEHESRAAAIVHGLIRNERFG